LENDVISRRGKRKTHTLEIGGHVQMAKSNPEAQRKSLLSDCTCALFAWLISHQPAVLFSQNKPATSNQPAVPFSQNKPAPATSHQPTEQTDGWKIEYGSFNLEALKFLMHFREPRSSLYFYFYTYSYFFLFLIFLFSFFLSFFLSFSHSFFLFISHQIFYLLPFEL
jgi:hypothetical protein